MSLWRKRNVHHNGQNQPKWFNMTALANNDLSIKSDDLSIKSEKAMREVQRLGQEIEQEPVAYISNKRQRLNIELKPRTFLEIPTVTDWEMPLYMKPPQRTWVGLTDEEIDALEPATDTLEFPQTVRAIEAKLKEKNT